MKLLIIILLLTSLAAAQRCDSVQAASSGGWKPIISAPRDGTTVELLETYGIAPWYGLFKWTKEQQAEFKESTGANKGSRSGERIYSYAAEASWVSVDKPGTGVSEDSCLYWRPYKKSGKADKYVDPTNGAQHTTAYWCAALHLPYDKKTDSCVSK